MRSLFRKFLSLFKKKKPRTRIIHEPPKLSRNYPRSFLDLALKLTGSFEGSGYDQISGNFDKQGISAGVLQWCYGQGSLQDKILKAYIAKYGSQVLDNHFPRPISESAYMTTKQAVRFAKKYMLNGTRLKPEWASAWRYFLTKPETIEIQKQAAGSVANKAWHYCEKYQFKSARAFCFFFDVVTQNGSMKGIPLPVSIDGYIDAINVDAGKNKTHWLRSMPDHEAKLLYLLICKRVTRNRWASDVISRKGTIAHGVGYVHGKLLTNIHEAYATAERTANTVLELKNT